MIKAPFSFWIGYLSLFIGLFKARWDFSPFNLQVGNLKLSFTHYAGDWK